ncbi:MFS transporter [Streptomyces sp. GD-15H]|uniref:MFS transporter n=1 Tax=Streptomyces sp. GD-15H TaxID=3129112 RepID=UPI003251ED5D
MTIRRLLRKILPFLILCYIVAFLDRVNLGFAASHLNTDLGFTATLFGFGAGIFAIGYFLFEVPSNLILHRVGARIWIARIMVTWGVISACFAFVQGPVSFIALRFLLGVAEAGFFPGIVLYLSLWFPRRALGRATALFVLGLPASMLIGAPLSTGLIAGLDNTLGMTGWQWMFLVEGGLAVVVGIIAFFKLANGPSTAPFLTDEQRTWLVRTLADERGAKESVRHYGVVETLRNRRVLTLSLCIFFNITALFGITLWMPQIIQGFGGLTSTQSNLLTAVPYLCAGIAMFFNAQHSDRTGERRFHILVPAVLGGAGLLLAVATDSPVVGLVGLCIGASGILSSNVLFWGIPSMFLTGAAAAAGIAMVNSVGNLGGFVGPYLTGWARDAFGSHTAGMYLLGTMVTVYGLAIFAYLTVQRRTDAAAARRAGITDTSAVQI